MKRTIINIRRETSDKLQKFKEDWTEDCEDNDELVNFMLTELEQRFEQEEE